jgi:hypothetical protein
MSSRAPPPPPPPPPPARRVDASDAGVARLREDVARAERRVRDETRDIAREANALATRGGARASGAETRAAADALSRRAVDASDALARDIATVAASVDAWARHLVAAKTRASPSRANSPTGVLALIGRRVGVVSLLLLFLCPVLPFVRPRGRARGRGRAPRRASIAERPVRARRCRDQRRARRREGGGRRAGRGRRARRKRKRKRR